MNIRISDRAGCGALLLLWLFTVPPESHAQDAGTRPDAGNKTAAALTAPTAPKLGDSAPEKRTATESGAAGRPEQMDPARAQLQADAQRLLLLTEQLRAELSRSGKDTLSVEAMKKAAEVEKLAKSLKERIKKSD